MKKKPATIRTLDQRVQKIETYINTNHVVVQGNTTSSLDVFEFLNWLLFAGIILTFCTGLWTIGSFVYRMVVH